MLSTLCRRGALIARGVNSARITATRSLGTPSSQEDVQGAPQGVSFGEYPRVVGARIGLCRAGVQYVDQSAKKKQCLMENEAFFFF